MTENVVAQEGGITYLPLYMSMFIEPPAVTEPFVYKLDLSGV